MKIDIELLIIKLGYLYLFSPKSEEINRLKLIIAKIIIAYLGDLKINDLIDLKRINNKIRQHRFKSEFELEKTPNENQDTFIFDIVYRVLKRIERIHKIYSIPNSPEIIKIAEHSMLKQSLKKLLHYTPVKEEISFLVYKNKVREEYKIEL